MSLGKSNIKWLYENGGASIKLHMMNEGLAVKNPEDVIKLSDELMQIEKIRTAFSYFDQFIDFRKIPDRELWGLIHSCYENCFAPFFHFLYRIGFYKGVAIFDEKVEIMKPVYKYLMETYDFHGLEIINLLMLAGYLFDDMPDYINAKIGKSHRITTLNCFDFYETDIDKIRQPKRWKDYLIVKDKYNPHGDEYPLPTNYDVELYNDYLTPENGWNRLEYETKTGMAREGERDRLEVLWYNY